MTTPAKSSTKKLAQISPSPELEKTIELVSQHCVLTSVKVTDVIGPARGTADSGKPLRIPLFPGDDVQVPDLPSSSRLGSLGGGSPDGSARRPPPSETVCSVDGERTGVEQADAEAPLPHVMVSHESADTPVQASKRYLGASGQSPAPFCPSAFASQPAGPTILAGHVEDQEAQLSPVEDIAMTREDYRQLLVDYEEIEDLTCPICMDKMELDQFVVKTMCGGGTSEAGMRAPDRMRHSRDGQDHASDSTN